MERVIPWDSLIKLIEPYYQEAETGRKKKQLVLIRRDLIRVANAKCKTAIEQN